MINQSTLVLARVHIIHTSIRSYSILFVTLLTVDIMWCYHDFYKLEDDAP